MPLKDSIDSRNQAFYDELSTKATIVYEENSIDDSWTMKKVGDAHYKIIAPPGKPSAELLTHELLHVQLDLEGFKDHDYIADRCNLPFELIEAVNNNLAHFKMLGRYTKMGYDSLRFLDHLPTNIENTFNAELDEVQKSYGANKMVDLLLQSTIEMNWLRSWLGLDTSVVDAKIQALDPVIYADVNQAIEDWQDSSVSVDYNINVFIERLKPIRTKNMAKHVR